MDRIPQGRRSACRRSPHPSPSAPPARGAGQGVGEREGDQGAWGNAAQSDEAGTKLDCIPRAPCQGVALST